MPGHVANLPPLICNAQRFSGAGRRGAERFRRARSDCGAISRKDSVGSSRRTALPFKPVARNLVAIDCSRCITELRLGNLNVSSGSGAHIHRINKRPFKVVRVEGRLTTTLPPDIERKVNDRIGRVARVRHLAAFRLEAASRVIFEMHRNSARGLLQPSTIEQTKCRRTHIHSTEAFVQDSKDSSLAAFPPENASA